MVAKQGLYLLGALGLYAFWEGWLLHYGQYFPQNRKDGEHFRDWLGL